MDVLAQETIKGTARCDKHCDLQNSVNHWNLECVLCSWDIPESMPPTASLSDHSGVSVCVLPVILTLDA